MNNFNQSVYWSCKSLDEIEKGLIIQSDSNVYVIEKILGRGAFGLVAKCCTSSQERVALKIMAKESGYSANKELEAVLKLRKLNPDQINTIACSDWFLYQGFYCFAYELLDRSLLDFMEDNYCMPLRVSEIRAIAKQILVCLTALGELEMAHTDIKLDNIMLVDHSSTPFRVKLIDFGLCHSISDVSQLDILQAKAYRAPEVYLGYPATEAVDMWGLAVTLGELYLGQGLVPGVNDYEILSSIIHLFGQPDKRILDRGSRTAQYFTLHQTESETTWRFKTAEKYQEEFGGRIREENNEIVSLEYLLEMAYLIENPHEVQDVKEFLDLLKRMLAVNPGDRIKPADALKHDFITMKHLPVFSNDSYVKEAFQIMENCQPRLTEDLPMDQDSTNTLHHGPTMEPPVINNPEAGDGNLIDSLNSEPGNLMDEISEGFTICNKSDVYHVETFLGRGAYGLVAKCRINETDQRVALKVMSKKDAYSANKELEALLHLRRFHPDQINIMTCFDWFKYKDNFCFTFELLDRSLYDFMKQRDWSPLRVSEIRAIAKQILVSLTALGELQMAHTDIKPDNLMLVDHTSTPFRVKLIDFGLTHFTSDLVESDLFQARGYRAPEVYLGFLPNEAVDIWGLAVTLTELYLGQAMFSGDTEYEILRSIVNLLGQPDKYVLDRACRATQYFMLHHTDSEITWKLKPARQYQQEFGERIRDEKDGKLQSLDDLLEITSFIGNPHEVQDLRVFVDLLKRMLAVNPGDRIKPADALKHDFITMKHLPVSDNDSYITEAFQVMSQFQPKITEHLPMEQVNTNTSHPGPSEEPPASYNPEAGDSDLIDSLNSEPGNLMDEVEAGDSSVVEAPNSESNNLDPGPSVEPPERELKHQKPFRRLRKFFARIFNVHHILS